MALNDDMIILPGYLALVVNGICFIVMISTLVHLIYKTRSKLPQTSIYLSYVSVFFYSLYALHYVGYSIYGISITESSFEGRVCTYGFFFQFYFIVGKVFMFIFYLTRLYHIFYNTTFKYSKRSLGIFATFIIIGYLSSASIFTYIVIKGLSRTDFNEIHNFTHCVDAIEYQNDFQVALVGIAIMINLVVDLVVTVIILRYV